MNPYFAIFTLLGSFVLTFLIIPRIIAVAYSKRLVDRPNGRSSHKSLVPRLGGVAFYLTLILALYFMQRSDVLELSDSIIPSLTILFIVGLKDDLVVLTARSKFFTHLVVATFLFFDPILNVQELHGFLEIYHVNPIFSGILIYLIVIGLINALNLTDGIDGLAAGISISSFLGFGMIFFFTDNEFSFLLCISMIGTLLAFIPYNVFKEKRKIFMGDTGATIIGFLLAFMTIRVLTIPHSTLSNIEIKLSNLPFFLMFILFIPILDTIRVMTMRIIRRKNPFSPDRTHLHHLFIDRYGWSHKKVSGILSLFSVGMILLGYWLCTFLNYLTLLGIFILLFISSCFVIQRLLQNETADRTNSSPIV